MNKTITTIIIVIVVIIVGVVIYNQSTMFQPSGSNTPAATPNIGNPLPKTDVVRLTDPEAGQIVSSPLNLKGEARGTWYSEGSFPIVLTDSTGKVLAQGVGKAAGNWQTNEFVPFSAVLTFNLPASVTNRKATITLKKDNPSGLASKDASIQIPVVIK